MFGNNPIEKKLSHDGTHLQIVKGSPFRTIQGEGPYIGRPAVFIRLHGCNLACTFCDTQFSDPKDPIVPISEIIRRTRELFGPEEEKLVVITGGEPFRQNILPLCRDLYAYPQVKIQIETAGSLWVDGVDNYADIIVSPKTGSIHPKAFAKAKAFKYIIDSKQSFEDFVPITATQRGARPAVLAHPRTGAPVYLSPMDVYDPVGNAANAKLVGELALKYGCLAGTQLHKQLGLD